MTVNHAGSATEFNNDFNRTTWHDESLWFVRQKRDKAVFAVPEFQQLRELASNIKEHTLSNLDQYLIEFEQNAIKLSSTAPEGGTHFELAAS